MCLTQGDSSGARKDRRAAARAQEEILVANALVELGKCCKIICSRQGDILEAVLRNLDKNQYDIEALGKDVTSDLKKVLRRVRKYG